MSIIAALKAQESHIAQLIEQHAAELKSAHIGWAWVSVGCLAIGFLIGVTV